MSVSLLWMTFWTVTPNIGTIEYISALELMYVQVLHCEIQRERRICSMGIQGHHSETSHNWNTLCGQHVRVLYLYLARRSEGKMECICVPENPWIRFVYTPWSLTQMFCLVCIAEQTNPDSIYYYRYNYLQTKKVNVRLKKKNLISIIQNSDQYYKIMIKKLLKVLFSVNVV